MCLRVLVTAVLLSLWTFGAGANSPEPSRLALCGATVGPTVFVKYQNLDLYDKIKHCAASCELTKLCGPMDSLELGALKELSDLTGFGDYEWADLRADLRGIRIAFLRSTKKLGDCLKTCKEVYPKTQVR